MCVVISLTASVEAYLSDSTGVEIIKSYDELKINDVLDPHSDFSLPPNYLTSFAPALDRNRIKSLSLKPSLQNVSGIQSVARENAHEIHKVSNMALLASRHLSSYVSKNPLQSITIISQMKLPADFCPNLLVSECDAYNQYSNTDGSCNNLINPWWGQSATPFKRLLPPEFDDLFTEPRTKSVMHGKLLPSAKILANLIESSIYPNFPLSTFFFDFYQLIFDDIARVAPTLNEANLDPKLCSCMSEDKDCFNIPLPLNEISVADCLPYTRSAVSFRTFDCYLGAREQLNLAASFIDLDQIEFERLELRGKRSIDRPRQKRFANDIMIESLDEFTKTIQLAVQQQIQDLNPDWNEEKMFLEARKITIGVLQHITYDELLPLILGDTIYEKYDLKTLKHGYSYKYNQNLYPSASNEFASAAFSLGYLSARVNLEETKQELIDSIAVVVQRGRDHGIPAYFKYRELCGLGKVKSFHDLTNMPRHVVEKLRRIYPSVFDIDLFVGGASELPVEGGIVGPTFGCIIAKQFNDLKFGDRFYYEFGNSKFTRFNLNQLQSIRESSLSVMLCQFLNIDKVPRRPLLKPHFKHNPLIDCRQLKPFNINPWFVNTTQIEELNNLINSLIY
ncbi:thyroid peroxidase-like [Brachionus plicatilis]|uniref:Thyroid peroxidase-like n=1 Tax=Brachionus plicatilis TaxID=10195 RepID=A0A3M7QB00_BRAPC|nr:thyroid peroxidase-like [Brachionus plicatilis]